MRESGFTSDALLKAFAVVVGLAIIAMAYRVVVAPGDDDDDRRRSRVSEDVEEQDAWDAEENNENGDDRRDNRRNRNNKDKKVKGKIYGREARFADAESGKSYSYCRRQADCSDYRLASGEYKEMARQFDQAVVEATTISDKEETEAGEEIWKAMRDQSDKQISESGDLVRYVRSVGDKIAKGSGRRGIRYKFFVMEDDTINAFAMPGGYVVVNRGLLKKMKNEAQLAFVLGHEIAHIELRHTISNYQLAKKLLGGVNDISMTLVWFSRLTMTSQQEKEADERGLKLVLRQEYSPFQSVKFMEMLPAGQSLSEQLDIHIEFGNPILDALLREIERAFLDEIEHMATTHPKPAHRACLLKQKVHKLLGRSKDRWFVLGKDRYAASVRL